MTGIVRGKVERPLIICGDALRLPLRDNSVDICITSPPYFSLRSYGTGHKMEIGSEATPHAYLEALWAATAEMKRVLKPTGSIWINLGDKYNGAGPTAPWKFANGQAWAREQRGGQASHVAGIPNKSLMGLPWRYAIGCIDQLSLILRRDLIWDKPNGLPESVTDRPRSSHEYWFMFVKQPRYFAALDEIREAYHPATAGKYAGMGPDGWHESHAESGASRNPSIKLKGVQLTPNPLGKLPGSVWAIPSEPLRLPPWIDTAHYAAFPTEWPRRLILGFTPHLICSVCKVGRFPVVDRQVPENGHRYIIKEHGSAQPPRRFNNTADDTRTTILGYACGCTPFIDHPGTGERHANSGLTGRTGGLNAAEPARSNHFSDAERVGPWREYHLDRFTPPPGHPAIVLDSFGGTGTVAHVARALGRHAISIDLSESYCRLATDQTLARQRAGKVLSRVHLERQGTLL